MPTKQDSTHTYIDTQEELDRLAGRLRQTPHAAMDTEADSLHRYSAKISLIQLTLEGDNYIIDPLADVDLTNFLDALSHCKLILHGGDYDLRMMLGSLGFRPKREVYDTLVAAQLLGHTQFGLVAIVEHYLDIQLSKQGQKSDWSRRPLTANQLAYACDDTRFLDPLVKLMDAKLAELGRIDWHRESCEAVVRATSNHKPPPDLDVVWRFKGLSYLTRRELSYVRAIWFWRDEEARLADRPPFKIMPNQLIIDMAIRAAANAETFALQRVRLPKHCQGRRLKALQAVFDDTALLGEDELPMPRKLKTWPFPKPKIEPLKAECAQIAEQLGLEPSVVAARAALEAIARERPVSIEGIMQAGPVLRWQAQLIESAVKTYLANTPPDATSPKKNGSN